MTNMTNERGRKGGWERKENREMSEMFVMPVT